MTLYHDPSDPPRVCWACIDDAVNAPDEPMPEHDPEIAGTDPDTGPYCVCGHSLEDVAPMRTDRIVLTIAHDQPGHPGPGTVDQMAALLAACLNAAGITATVTAEPFTELTSPWPLGWTCPADDAEHWPARTLDAGAEPGTAVECGHCGYVQTWTGTAWQDPRS